MHMWGEGHEPRCAGACMTSSEGAVRLRNGLTLTDLGLNLSSATYYGHHLRVSVSSSVKMG